MASTTSFFVAIRGSEKIAILEGMDELKAFLQREDRHGIQCGEKHSLLAILRNMDNYERDYRHCGAFRILSEVTRMVARLGSVKRNVYVLEYARDCDDYVLLDDDEYDYQELVAFELFEATQKGYYEMLCRFAALMEIGIYKVKDREEAEAFYTFDELG